MAAFFALIVLLICVWLYLLPWAIASARQKLNVGPIALINIFFGWTVVGWIAALIWACTDREREPTRVPCRYCAERILPNASVCPHCRRELVESVIAL